MTDVRGAIGLGLVLSALPGIAHASDEAVADALYRDGQRLITQGKVHEACLKFVESGRIDPAAGTLISTAACHEREGKLATALAEFNDAAATAQRAHEPDRERYARSHAATLDRAVYRVTVRFASPPAGLALKLDDRVLGVGALGSAIPLDPGRHHLELSLVGRASWTKDVDVPATGGGDELAVSLDDMPADRAATHAPAEPSLLPAIAAGGAGVAALVAGSVMVALATANGNAASSSAATANQMMNTAAYDAAESQYNSAVSLRTAGFVVGALGLCAVAAGTVLFVRVKLSRGTAAAHDVTLRLGPTVFPLVLRGQGAGLGGTF